MSGTAPSAMTHCQAFAARFSAKRIVAGGAKIFLLIHLGRGARST